jgi:hypothetical protein
MMILLDELTGLAVNSADISWVNRDSQSLTVTMCSGAELLVKDRPVGRSGEPGVNVREVHRRILEAK